MHYNIDLRRKVISAIKRGESKVSVARMFGLDRKTIYNWLARPAPYLNGHTPARLPPPTLAKHRRFT